MSDFTESLQGRLRALREDYGLHLERLHVGAPATDDQIATAEAALGVPMGAALRATPPRSRASWATDSRRSGLIRSPREAVMG